MTNKPFILLGVVTALAMAGGREDAASAAETVFTNLGSDNTYSRSVVLFSVEPTREVAAISRSHRLMLGSLTLQGPIPSCSIWKVRTTGCRTGRRLRVSL